MLRVDIPSSRLMDDSDDDILLAEDMNEPIKSMSEEPLSSEEVLDAEISPISSKGQISSVFSSMVDSVGSIFTKIITTLKSTANSASSKADSIKKSRNEKQHRRLAIAQTKEKQDEMVMVASEIQSYTWEILGMDCPDCATKANQAISRMDGVESCDVSVIEGTISVSIDLSLITVSRISRILDGIGFPPNRLWETIQGVTPKMIEDNRTIDRRTLRREIQNVPEILDIQSSILNTATNKIFSTIADTSADLSESFGGVSSPPPFSSKEAKMVVDDALRKYSKELRKLQGKVVKDWMTKAKNGVIDFFDLVRGFQHGDMSRAYPYEVEFLQSVLTKDKIVDRFRKYFGGKKALNNTTAKKR